MQRQRSLLAIAAGLFVTVVLFQLTVDPIAAGSRRVLEGGGDQVGIGDWLFVAFATAVRFAPFVAGALTTAALARDGRSEHGLVTLNLSLVAWVLLSR